MAYNASKHEQFVKRLVEMRMSINNLDQELGKLLAIYEHETASGGNAAFVDTPDQTKAEIQAFLTLLTGLQATLTTSQNMAIMAPFLRI